MISFRKQETHPCQSCIRTIIKCSDKIVTRNTRQGLRIRKVLNHFKEHWLTVLTTTY